MLKIMPKVVAVAMVLFATAVWAQPPAQVARCRADNQRAHSEIMQMFQRARAQGNISPAESRAFSDMERRLNGHSQMLNRGGLTLGECQQIGRELANERANVQRMAASPDHQQIARCRTDNQRAHSEIMQMFQRARAQGNISPAESRAFSDMERRLQGHSQMLNRGGLTLGECQQISRELANERANVQRMAASGPAQVAKCRSDNQRAHAEVMQMFQKARSRGKITPNESRAFSDMERRLQGHSQMLNRGGLTLGECQQIGREIANERANVQRMAAGR